MGPTGLRITIRTLMVTVAIVAVTLATTHVENDRIIGTLIVVASVGYLAHIRYCESISLRQRSGVTSNSSQKFGVLVASIILATVVIGLSDLAWLTGYFGYLRVADALFETCHGAPSTSPVGMIQGWIIGGFLAVGVASCLRRTVWIHDRPESWHARRRLKLWWPVGLSIMIGVFLIGDHAWNHCPFCTMMAHYHARPEALAVGSRKATLHAWLKRWHKHAAFRPWLPDYPRRLPPGMEEG